MIYLQLSIRWRDTTNQNSLSTHQEIFVPPQVYNPAPGVYVAVGYDLGNSILVVNNNQAVLIDTVGSLATGNLVKAAFEAALGTPIPPIVAVVYTHSHPDHFGGTLAFTIPTGTPIISAATFLLGLQKTLATQAAVLSRSSKQFGFFLGAPDVDGFLGCGIGPKVFYDSTPKLTPPIVNPNAISPLAPTTRTLAGLEFRFLFTSGETDDTITVYIPSLKVVMVGDNVYKGFPNLYAIRGTPPRDVKAWYLSVDAVRNIQPGPAEVLIGSHSPPIVGAATIASTLTTYRDGIQYVHDQTVAMINQGLFPDDIANAIVLPPALADAPFLQEYYGFIPWCVKSIFTFYLGWFSGNIAQLDLPSTSVQANRFVDLAGGPLIAIVKAVDSLNDGTIDGAQWALQISDAVLKSAPADASYISYAQDIYIQAAQIIGLNQKSSNGRNYYLSVVEELVAQANPATAAFLDQLKEHHTTEEHMGAIPALFMETVLPIRVNPSKTAELVLPVKVLLKDVDLEYSIAVRRGIAEVFEASSPIASSYDFAFEVTFATAHSFKSVILGLTTVEGEIINQNIISSNASIEEMSFFFDLFQ